MSVLTRLIEEKKRQSTWIDVCLDPALAEAFAQVRQRWQKAQRESDAAPTNQQLGAAAADTREEYDAKLAEIRGVLVRLTFVAIDGDQLDELKGQHRPTEHQRTEARKRGEQPPEVNTDTFPPVLIATTCVKVEDANESVDGLTLEDAERLWKSTQYNSYERQAIYNTAVNAQLKVSNVGDIPKG